MLEDIVHSEDGKDRKLGRREDENINKDRRLQIDKL
jgi:hypothetical protein